MTTPAALLLVSLSLSAAAQAPKPSPKPSPPPDPVLQGTVKGPDGKPVEKAVVLARLVGSPDPAILGRTDAAGAFRLVLKRSMPHVVRVEARGLAAQTLEKVRPGTPLTITLQKGGVIEGVVKDGSNRPIPGARVEARQASSYPMSLWEAGVGIVETVADAKGAFRLEGLAPGLHAVSAAARGYGRARRDAVPLGRRLELFLFPGASIRGLVRGTGDRPIAGAVVRIEGGARLMGAPLPPQATGADGRFELLGLDAGVYRLIVHHKDWAPGLLGGIVLERQGEIEADIRLEPGARVKGRLVDASERPAAGRVLIHELEGEASFRFLGEILRAEAGGDGRFQLERVPRGSHALSVEARGFAAKQVDVEVRDQDPVVDLGDVILETGASIRGRVRDRAGLGIADAQIRSSPQRSMSPGPPVETSTEADGSFVLAGLLPGSHRMTVRAAGYGSASKTVEPGTENLDIVLAPAGSITGVVVDDAGTSVESLRVEASPSRRESGSYMSTPGRSVTAQQGRFTLEDVAEGEYVVEVKAPEKGEAVVSGVKVAAGSVTDVGRVRLKTAGVLRGQVVDASGGPIPGATVTAHGPDRNFFGNAAATTTDATGAFEIKGVTAGAVEARATHPNFAEGRASGLEVDPAKGPTETRIVLTQGGRIEGSARKRGGAPLPGTFVSVAPARRDGPYSGPPVQAPTAPDGSFAIEHVAPGRVRVALMTRTGGGSFTSVQGREVDIQEGETKVVEFLSREILLAGRVTRGGSPLPGVRIRLMGGAGSMMMSFGTSGGTAASPASGPQRLTATSREDGGYEMLVDEPGRFHARFDTPDGRDLPGRSFEVPDAESFNFDFDFAGITLSGIVVNKETDQPVAQAEVAAYPKAGGAGGGRVSGRTGADGRFTLDVAGGAHHMTARAEGFAQTSQEVDVGTGGLSDVKLVLTPGVAIKGRIVDGRNRPVGGVSVSATPSETDPGTSSGFAHALADGSFMVEGLETRPYFLLGGSAMAGYAVQGPVSPGDSQVLLRLRPAGHVRLVVRGPDGAPLPEVHAFVRKVDGHRVTVAGIGPSTTDQAGTVEVTVPAGTVEIDASKGKLRGVLTVSVPEGGTVSGELKLEERAKTP